MESFKKLLSMLLVLAMLLSFAACNSPDSTESTGGTEGNTATKGNYSVQIKSAGIQSKKIAAELFKVLLQYFFAQRNAFQYR